MPRYCKQEGCDKHALYNLYTETIPFFCSAHKTIGMINVVSRCQYADEKEMCKKIGVFKDINGKRKCKEHSGECSLILTGRRCIYRDIDNIQCVKRKLYGFLGEVAKYCKEHKENDMIFINKYKECKVCKKKANYADSRGDNYCAEHRGNEYILLNNKCREKGCNRQKLYGYSVRDYCSKHKTEDMLYFGNREKCIEKGCKIQPSYNYPGNNRRIYCKAHKKEGMRFTRNIYCIHKDCDKIANYNYKGEKKTIYCATHREEGMINIKSKKCLLCNKIANYNYKGEKKTIYCATHREEGMINIKSKKCLSEWCDTDANKNYDNYCCYCFTNLFPKDPKSINARKKNKELAVKGWLFENGHSEFIHDKAIYLGKNCSSLRRVDLYKYIGDKHILCIEVDENQHKRYDKGDEENRYHELYREGYTQVFIRYNPDKYRDNTGKIRHPRFNTRMEKLLKSIDEWTEKIINNKCSEDLLYIEYIYYDENNCQLPISI